MPRCKFGHIWAIGHIWAVCGSWNEVNEQIEPEADKFRGAHMVSTNMKLYCREMEQFWVD
jgi:hypothetical protein